MLLGFMLCVRWPIGPLAQIKQFSEEVIRPLFAPCTLAELAALSLLAGIGEESLFRGVFQGLFIRWFGILPALIVPSVIFGLLHLITPTYAILAALMGIYLGCWVLFADNLLVAVIAHALYDFVALVYLVRRPA
jgi:membrane protease YdiL (CAAX protease family)